MALLTTKCVLHDVAVSHNLSHTTSHHENCIHLRCSLCRWRYYCFCSNYDRNDYGHYFRLDGHYFRLDGYYLGHYEHDFGLDHNRYYFGHHGHYCWLRLNYLWHYCWYYQRLDGHYVGFD